MSKSNEYNRLYLIYLGITDTKSNAIDDTSLLLQINNESSSTARFITKSLFHMRRSDQRSLGSMTSTDVNTYIDDTEKKSRDIIINELNSYIRYLEPFRYGDYKICALYAYLIFEGLFGILGDLYVPESLRVYLDRTIDEITTRSKRILQETVEYFEAKNDTSLTESVKSLGAILLGQRTDQVIHILSASYEFTDEDRKFLENQRYYYLKFTDNLDHSVIFEKLGISDTSYYRSLKVIVADLVTRLSDTNLELLTELFLRR